MTTTSKEGSRQKLPNPDQYIFEDIHMRQSRVENEHSHFNRIRTFKALYLRTSIKGGAHTQYVVASICEAFT